MTTRPFPYGESALVTVIANAASLPEPPTSAAYVGSWLHMSEGELELTASVAALLTDSEILGGCLDGVSISADDADAVLPGSDEMTVTAHQYVNGDGPVRITTSGSLPSGVASGTDYWLEVVDANTVRLHGNLASVFDGGSQLVDIQDAGSGTHTISASPNGAKRVVWISDGFFVEGAGTLWVLPTKGRRIRFTHSTRVVLYAVTGAMSGTITARILPVKTA